MYLEKRFFASITENNISEGFTRASLIPYDLKRVISNLNIRIPTLIPLTLSLTTILP